MRKIDVACAIIEKDGRVLAAQRSETMSLPLKWEFPGGKIEPGESAAACLVREIAEELAVGIVIGAALPPSNWRYPDFAITLHPFVCALNGEKADVPARTQGDPLAGSRRTVQPRLGGGRCAGAAQLSGLPQPPRNPLLNYAEAPDSAGEVAFSNALKRSRNAFSFCQRSVTSRMIEAMPHTCPCPS